MSEQSESAGVHVHMVVSKWDRSEDHEAGLPPDEVDEYDYEETT